MPAFSAVMLREPPRRKSPAATVWLPATPLDEHLQAVDIKLCDERGLRRFDILDSGLIGARVCGFAGACIAFAAPACSEVRALACHVVAAGCAATIERIRPSAIRQNRPLC